MKMRNIVLNAALQAGLNDGHSTSVHCARNICVSTAVCFDQYLFFDKVFHQGPYRGFHICLGCVGEKRAEDIHNIVDRCGRFQKAPHARRGLIEVVYLPILFVDQEQVIINWPYNKVWILAKCSRHL